MIDRRVVLITGGGTGIGRASVKALAGDWHVVVAGRRERPLQEAALSCGGDWVKADLSTPQGAESCIAAVMSLCGRIDGVVLNAGVSLSGSVTEVTLDDWDRSIRTNLSGAFWILRCAIPHMPSGGRLVAVASAAALRANARATAYSVSKAGLMMLMQTVAVDYGGASGLRANVVCPGWARTDMADTDMAVRARELGISLEDAYREATRLYPIKRPASPEEIAEAVRWLMSDGASYVNGAVITVDGGACSVDVGAHSPVPSLLNH